MWWPLEAAVEGWVEEAATPETLAPHTPCKMVESPKGGPSFQQPIPFDRYPGIYDLPAVFSSPAIAVSPADFDMNTIIRESAVCARSPTAPVIGYITKY